MKAVLFDMDGLIFDTERLGIDISLQLAKENDILLTEESFLKVIGTDEGTSEKMLKHLFRPDYTYWDLYKQREVITKEYIKNKEVPIKKGARRLLRELSKKKVLVGLVTSSYLEMAELFLKKAKLRDFFDTITTADEVEKSKPDPAIYLLAAEKMGVVPEKCMVLEDSYNGLIAGKKAGMKTVMIPDLKPFTQEISSYVNACFSSLEEAQEYILENTVGREG